MEFRALRLSDIEYSTLWLALLMLHALFQVSHRFCYFELNRFSGRLAEQFESRQIAHALIPFTGAHTCASYWRNRKLKMIFSVDNRITYSNFFNVVKLRCACYILIRAINESCCCCCEQCSMCVRSRNIRKVICVLCLCRTSDRRGQMSTRFPNRGMGSFAQ